MTHSRDAMESMAAVILQTVEASMEANNRLLVELLGKRVDQTIEAAISKLRHEVMAKIEALATVPFTQPGAATSGEQPPVVGGSSAEATPRLGTSTSARKRLRVAGGHSETTGVGSPAPPGATVAAEPPRVALSRAAASSQQPLLDDGASAHARMRLCLMKGGRPALDMGGIKHFFVHAGPEKQKFDILCDLLDTMSCPAAIFCNTPQKVYVLAKKMLSAGFHTSCIHSQMSRFERDAAVQKWQSGGSNYLIASADLAGSGIDTRQVTQLVVGYDFPTSPAIYQREVARSGLYGYEGVAISFVEDNIFVVQGEMQTLQAIEELHSTRMHKLPAGGGDSFRTLRACFDFYTRAEEAVRRH